MRWYPVLKFFCWQPNPLSKMAVVIKKKLEFSQMRIKSTFSDWIQTLACLSDNNGRIILMYYGCKLI